MADDNREPEDSGQAPEEGTTPGSERGFEGEPTSSEPPCGHYDSAFFRPINSWKAWFILTGIFVAIGVGVLYVYQAGDTKTVLGNQPIPADPEYGYTIPVALNAPAGGKVQAPRPPQPAGNVPAAAAGQNPSTLQCSKCGTSGLPVCSQCGAVMQSVGQGTGAGLYACPVCGSVGVPICPHCHAAMAPPVNGAQPNPGQPVANVGGQFYCPMCGATGLPNWNAGGVPICPNCQAQMQVR